MTENSSFYFTIHTFMTRELGLRGSALIIYAIIYSFSHDGMGTFYGSREALADFAGVSVSTVGKILKDLTQSNLIFVADGKNYEHKEYRVNADSIKNSSRNLPAEQPKSTCGAAENYPQRSRNLPAAQPKITCNNKHNNKLYNKPIINVYKGAEAPGEEKEKEVLKEDLKVDKKEAPSAADTPANAPTKANQVCEAADKPPNARRSSDKCYAKDYRRHENKGKNGEPPTFKHCHFDPEEAFRLALERSEIWMQEILAKEEAEANGKNNADVKSSSDSISQI